MHDELSPAAFGIGSRFKDKYEQEYDGVYIWQVFLSFYIISVSERTNVEFILLNLEISDWS